MRVMRRRKRRMAMLRGALMEHCACDALLKGFCIRVLSFACTVLTAH